MFVVLEHGGGVFKIAALAFAAIDLDFAELIERFLELAGEACAVESEAGEQAVGVDDVERRGLGAGGWGLGAREDVGLEKGNALQAPGGVGEFLDEMSFGCRGGLVFVDELAAVLLVSDWILHGQDGGLGGQAVAKGVERGTLFAGAGARAGGMLGVGAIDGGAICVVEFECWCC